MALRADKAGGEAMETEAARPRLASEWRETLVARLAMARSRLLDCRAPIRTRVHDVRKLMKECRALLRLAPDDLSGPAGAVRDELKAVRAALAGARDAQAALDALKDLKRHGAVPEATRNALKNALDDRKKRAETGSLRDALPRLADRLSQAGRTVDGWSSVRLGDEALIGRAVACYRRVRRRAPKNFVKAGVEPLHRLRSAVVDHRYQVEFLAKARFRGIAARVRPLQKLRDLLGQHHDLAVLRDVAAHGERDDLDKAIDRRQEAIARRAEALGTALIRTKPKRVGAALRHQA